MNKRKTILRTLSLLGLAAGLAVTGLSQAGRYTDSMNRVQGGEAAMGETGRTTVSATGTHTGGRGADRLHRMHHGEQEVVEFARFEGEARDAGESAGPDTVYSGRRTDHLHRMR